MRIGDKGEECMQVFWAPSAQFPQTVRGKPSVEGSIVLCQRQRREKEACNSGIVRIGIPSESN